ncbi:hypothetical protein AVEN_155818-1 [Araneus ventricosus]|uniref:Uncharacterized protein n=1 Tax=Araneus ventricosus TaxID=182803 RepID=A0A4Y2G8V5_ARAVE|nr:hypothetical protein AVEN_155818-1 [Araneus ventricosus]
MPTPYEKEMEPLRKLRAEVETDEDADFDNGPEDGLEDTFSVRESFSKYDTELVEKIGMNGNSGNEEVNNTERFSSEDGVKWRKINLRQNIRSRCHNIVSRSPGVKGP